MVEQRQNGRLPSSALGASEAPRTLRHDDGAASPAFMDFASSLGGVFDEAFDVYKRHFSTLALIVASIVVPVQIILQAIDALWLRPLNVQMHDVLHSSSTSRAFAVVALNGIIGSPGYGIPGLLSLAAMALVSAPIAIALSDIFSGKQPSTGSSYRRAWRYFLPLLVRYSVAACAFAGAWLLAFLVLGLVLAMFSLLVSMAASVLPAAAEILAITALIVLAVGPYITGCAMIAKFFAFTTPLTVLEHRSFSGLITRSEQLIGPKRFKRTWAVVILLPLVTFGLQSIILASLNQTLVTSHFPPWANFALITIASTSVIYFLQPYWILCLTLLYYDYRIQRDGLDLHILSGSLPSIEDIRTQLALDVQAAQTPVPATQPLMREVPYVDI